MRARGSLKYPLTVTLVGRGMKPKVIMAFALFLVIMMPRRMSIVAEPAAPDLSIEGVVLPYFGPVYAIYPTPEPYLFYRINVTVANEGTAEAGRFNVSLSVHLEGEIMPEHGRKKTVEGLQQGANENLLFDWNPQDYGNYTLTIVADSDNDIVELDETNNVKIVWVIGTIRGDMDGDGYVGSADFSILAGLYGKRFESPPYPTADINWDGYVGSADFSRLAGNYGQSI